MGPRAVIRPMLTGSAGMPAPTGRSALRPSGSRGHEARAGFDVRERPRADQRTRGHDDDPGAVRGRARLSPHRGPDPPPAIPRGGADAAPAPEPGRAGGRPGGDETMM